MHVLPEQRHCTLALTLQASELYWRDEHHSFKRNPLIRYFDYGGGECCRVCVCVYIYVCVCVYICPGF